MASGESAELTDLVAENWQDKLLFVRLKDRQEFRRGLVHISRLPHDDVGASLGIMSRMNRSGMR
jgi:hypothetical protein